MGTSLLETALAYAHSGLSVHPVKPGCKGPRGPWKEYQSRIASDEQIARWFDTPNPMGICIIAGEVSGTVDEHGTIYGLECLDCDDPSVVERFLSTADAWGMSDLIARLPSEQSPRMGRHWGWRSAVWQGNVTLAERDLSRGNAKRIQALIELKGEGGTCTVFPTPIGIHPDHPERAYERVSGSWADIPIITPDERQQIIDLCRSLNEHVRPARVRAKSPLQRGPVIQGERPGDRLNAEANHEWWQHLLEHHGWRLVHHHGDIDYWQRPGKGERDKGASATYGACGPYFYVFSSSAYPFEAEQAYKPFAALALLDFDGDFKACAQHLQPRYATSTIRNNGRFEYPPDEGDYSTIDAALQDAIEQEQSRFHDLRFDLTDKLKVKETLGNYVRMFGLHPEWKGRLAFNSFARRQELDGRPLTNKDRIGMGVWACNEYQIDGRYRNVRDEAIFHVSTQNSYDPLLTYVESLPEWDGKNRLDYWLPLWAGAEDTDLSHWIGKMMITQMIARALYPGSIARYVVVLKGQENTGKSQLVMALGQPWAITFDMSMDQKEAHMAIQGAWVAELAELDTLRRTSETRLKSFVSQSHDNFVPKYSNDREDIPRRCVFVGTTNDEEFLISETGNTRFLPVTTGRIQLDQIRENRDQLFAQSKKYFLEFSQNWWVEPESLAEKIFEARDMRRTTNVYEEPLREWLDGVLSDGDSPQNVYRRDEIGWPEIARDFLDITRKDWKDKGLQMQIASALKAIGWEKQSKRVNGKVRKMWLRAKESQ